MEMDYAKCHKLQDMSFDDERGFLWLLMAVSDPSVTLSG